VGHQDHLTVPINDETFAAFDVTHTPLEGEEARAYTAVASGTGSRSRRTLGPRGKNLAGDMTLEELPDELSAYTSFAIEDYVPRSDRADQWSRRSAWLIPDKKVILMRRLWLQEVSALLAEKPLTEWKIPQSPFRPWRRHSALVVDFSRDIRYTTVPARSV